MRACPSQTPHPLPAAQFVCQHYAIPSLPIRVVTRSAVRPATQNSLCKRFRLSPSHLYTGNCIAEHCAGRAGGRSKAGERTDWCPSCRTPIASLHSSSGSSSTSNDGVTWRVQYGRQQYHLSLQPRERLIDRVAALFRLVPSSIVFVGPRGKRWEQDQLGAEPSSAPPPLLQVHGLRAGQQTAIHAPWGIWATGLAQQAWDSTQETLQRLGQTSVARGISEFFNSFRPSYGGGRECYT